MVGPMAATLEIGSRCEWRRWLEEHHRSSPGVWLVFARRGGGGATLAYEDAVEEALCFGWVDSLVKRLDDARYARKFTARRPDSRWSTANRRRWARLRAGGLLAEAGLERAPTNRSGDAPRPSLAAIPADIEEGLRADPQAWRSFEELAPSYRRAYVGWIDAARRTGTRAKRLREAVRRLRAGEKLGLK
jgi:uncharacterized protein YdeI (YjbR/CyaY-like superfamily)